MTIEELENAQEAKTLPQKKQSKMRVRITDDLALLIETYYKNVELSSEIISKLFNTECTSTIAKLKKMARRISFFMAINPQFRLKEFGYEKSETALRFRFYFLLCALPCERLLCSQRSLRPSLSCN